MNLPRTKVLFKFSPNDSNNKNDFTDFPRPTNVLHQAPKNIFEPLLPSGLDPFKPPVLFNPNKFPGIIRDPEIMPVSIVSNELYDDALNGQLIRNNDFRMFTPTLILSRQCNHCQKQQLAIYISKVNINLCLPCTEKIIESYRHMQKSPFFDI